MDEYQSYFTIDLTTHSRSLSGTKHIIFPQINRSKFNVYIIIFALHTRSIGTYVGMKLGVNSYVAFVLNKAGELSVQIPLNPP